MKRMLRAVISGQSALKQELLSEIRKVDAKVEKLTVRMDQRFTEVNARLDTQGKSLAYLEDDTPTNEEFNKLEKRVSKLESPLLGS